MLYIHTAQNIDILLRVRFTVLKMYIFLSTVYYSLATKFYTANSRNQHTYITETVGRLYNPCQ